MSIIIFKKNRLYISIFRIFIKLSLTNLPLNRNAKKVRSFYKKLKILRINTIYYEFRVINLNIEISKRILNTKNNINNNFLFNEFIRLINSYDHLKNISWKAILPNQLLLYIKNNFKEMYEFINFNLDKNFYPDTGIHGDFGPGNLLSNNNKYFLIDWELSKDTGSFIWDIFDFYCTFKRETTAPGLDIISIKNKSKDIPFRDLREMLIIYSLMKFRRDILRHKRDSINSIKSLEKRIKNIP